MGCLLESIKRDLKRRPIYEYRCDERLKTKDEGSTRPGNIVGSIKRELKIRGIYECRCDERLQTKTKEFTRLTYTGLIEFTSIQEFTRLRFSEKFIMNR